MPVSFCSRLFGEEIFTRGAEWKFLNGRAEASSPDATGWRQIDFDDSAYQPPKLLVVNLEASNQPALNSVKQSHTLLPDIPIIGINADAHPAFLYELLNAGVAGVLEKDFPPDRVPAYLRLVLEGGVALSPTIARMLTLVSEQLDSLTQRERMIVNRLLAGRRQKEVADDLGISVNTVHTHLRRLFRKHGVHSWKSFVRTVLRPPQKEE